MKTLLVDILIGEKEVVVDRKNPRTKKRPKKVFLFDRHLWKCVFCWEEKDKKEKKKELRGPEPWICTEELEIWMPHWNATEAVWRSNLWKTCTWLRVFSLLMLLVIKVELYGIYKGQASLQHFWLHFPWTICQKTPRIFKPSQWWRGFFSLHVYWILLVSFRFGSFM